jgi:branched-chain amino acid transport system substrate-binding protein
MKRAVASIGIGLFSLGFLGAFACVANSADIKIGAIYDYTGPFAGGGSKAAGIGNKIAIDLINERGGVEGNKIVGVFADSQSKTDVAINEAERLLNEQKVDLIMGVYSSAHCVPMAAKVDAAKKFMWANVCVASAVLKDRNLQYVFRPQVHSDQFGEASCSFIAENAKSKLGKEVKDLKVAIIHEDGPYGVGVAMGNEAKCKELGMQVGAQGGLFATAADLSALVTKLRPRPGRRHPAHRLQPGHHAVPAPVRRRRACKFSVLIGHGAGYGQIDKLIETFKDDVNLFYNVDPVAAQLLDPKTLKPGPRRAHQRDGQALQGRDRRARGAAARVDGLQPGLDLPHRRAAARHQEARRVRPRGAEEGGARDRHPEGGTIQGYGVKFFPPGHKMAGQNERSSPVVMQYVKGVTKISWPTAIKTADPVLPLPAGHAYAR